MKTLIEELHDNNVIFSYYGFIDENVLQEVMKITVSKLEGNKESPAVVKKVTGILSDCVDNIIKHNFYPDDSRVKYKSLLVVSKKANNYSIDTIHVINDEQKKIIDEHLSYLNGHAKEELQTLRSSALIQNDTATLTAPGLVELILKADEWICNFKKLANSFLVNIHFMINSQA